ncbi:hypothetical protein [Enterobacter roggenkampii]|uniref:hypothetical protein n=1 Tax=Enterobacter roggenkampii TaxID=1812935 RepID=UPI002DB923D9|nr:hypothetical protein [Enterobacter roggenkampii]MEB5890016.1 hypothetical protein [Enterobacter roggenkampii]
MNSNHSPGYCGIAKIDAYRPYSDIEHNVIRHGPHVNFVSYMMAHEPDIVSEHGGVTGAVTNSGKFPLAMAHKGKWSIIENIGQLASFYSGTGTRIKEAWLPGGKRQYVANSEARTGGIVSARHTPGPVTL